MEKINKVGINCLCGHGESCRYCSSSTSNLVEIDIKDLKKIEKMLNTTIRNLLYGGTTEAGWGACAGSAVCFKTLKILKLGIEDEDDIRQLLETDNVSEENFLK